MPTRKTASPRPTSGTATTAVTTTPLSSSAIPAADLIDVGSRFATDKLTGAVDTLLPKLAAHPKFATFGFDDNWVHNIHALVTTIETQREKLATAAEDALPTGQALDTAVAEAKEWRRDAATIAAILPGDHHGIPKSSGSSVARLASSMRALAPVVARATVTPEGNGRAMRARGLALVTRLTDAAKAHRVALAKLSPESRALHAAKGSLYEELKRLGRVARRVAPAESALFAVSSHVRGSHHHRRAPATNTATSPATAPA